MRKSNPENRCISGVVPGSIAEELGIAPGDTLLSIDGREVLDVFDFRLRELTDELTLRFLLSDGTQTDYDIQKDEDEELGLIFREPLLDSCRTCVNHCLFCFVDQLPKGMRSTLYFKDDDPRMSFLTGNYVTLTNLSDKEVHRIFSYKLSPLNVSVHTTNPKLRTHMMKSSSAGNIMKILTEAVRQGILLNCQIVLCPGINDGPELERTVDDLVSLGEGLNSIAVVPVGLTRYRDENGLFRLKPYDRDSAGKVIDAVNRRQNEFLRVQGRRILFAADEFYIRADRQIPSAKAYDGFPQLENGVGLLAARREEISRGIAARKRRKSFLADGASRPKSSRSFLLIVGVDAAPFVTKQCVKVAAHYGAEIEVLAVKNLFFGDCVTVTGLLTGRDILLSLKQRVVQGNMPDTVLLPDVTLRTGECVFLDDMSVADLSDQSGLPVITYSSTGQGLLEVLDSLVWEDKTQSLNGTEDNDYE